MVPRITFQQDPSRYGVSVYEDGYRVLGTWAMSQKAALEKYNKLGDKRELDRGVLHGS